MDIQKALQFSKNMSVSSIKQFASAHHIHLTDQQAQNLLLLLKKANIQWYINGVPKDIQLACLHIVGGEKIPANFKAFQSS